MEERQEFRLQLRRQVDEQVPAAHQVELGEGRIHDEILPREDDHLPDGPGDLVAAIQLDEEPVQPLRRHIRGDVGWEHRRAGFLDGVFVEVGREDLERVASGRLELLQRLFEDDGQGIGFLPSRAGGHPDPQRLVGRAVFQQGRDDPGPQRFPPHRVAEEARDPDQEFLEQQLRLLGILLQIPDIVGDPINLVDAHAPLDPAIHRAVFVEGKVVA